jgi:hydrogenase expression/formation protein HypE
MIGGLMSKDFTCPVPFSEYDKILLGHGSGGTLSHRLFEQFIHPHFSNNILDELNDSAVFEIGDNKIAFTTDSYVVQPIFFPGGDVGKLAVNGTVNDLAMAGAKPLFISVGLILEEGFAIEDLSKIILSMKSSADYAGVKIVTGDTKVVEKGKGDKIFINTAGIGIVAKEINIAASKCEPGDVIILSGKIAEHGIAILSVRERLEFETTVKSDTAPLNKLVNEMLDASKNIHVLRDPTRGGLATTLNELAGAAQVGMFIEEEKISINEEVKAACEILGIDPLYIANEGKLVAIVQQEDAEKVLHAMHKNEFGKDAAVIGEVTQNNPGEVIMKTIIGTKRIIDMLSGEQLPRIC